MAQGTDLFPFFTMKKTRKGNLRHELVALFAEKKFFSLMPLLL